MGRRIVTFRFEKAVANPDEGLKRKLISEAAGVFWWAWSMPNQAMHDALRNRGKVAAIREASIEGALERDHVLRSAPSQKRANIAPLTSTRHIAIGWKRRVNTPFQQPNSDGKSRSSLGPNPPPQRPEIGTNSPPQPSTNSPPTSECRLKVTAMVS